MQYAGYFDLESKLALLQKRRHLIEKKTDQRREMIEKFDTVRKSFNDEYINETLDNFRNASIRNIRLLEEFDHTLKKFNHNQQIFKEENRHNSDDLEKARQDYFTKIHSFLPQYHQTRIQFYEKQKQETEKQKYKLQIMNEKIGQYLQEERQIRDEIQRNRQEQEHIVLSLNHQLLSYHMNEYIENNKYNQEIIQIKQQLLEAQHKLIQLQQESRQLNTQNYHISKQYQTLLNNTQKFQNKHDSEESQGFDRDMDINNIYHQLFTTTGPTHSANSASNRTRLDMISKNIRNKDIKESNVHVDKEGNSMIHKDILENIESMTNAMRVKHKQYLNRSSSTNNNVYGNNENDSDDGLYRIDQNYSKHIPISTTTMRNSITNKNDDDDDDNVDENKLTYTGIYTNLLDEGIEIMGSHDREDYDPYGVLNPMSAEPIKTTGRGVSSLGVHTRTPNSTGKHKMMTTATAAAAAATETAAAVIELLQDNESTSTITQSQRYKPTKPTTTTSSVSNALNHNHSNHRAQRRHSTGDGGGSGSGTGEGGGGKIPVKIEHSNFSNKDHSKRHNSINMNNRDNTHNTMNDHVDTRNKLLSSVERGQDEDKQILTNVTSTPNRHSSTLPSDNMSEDIYVSHNRNPLHKNDEKDMIHNQELLKEVISEEIPIVPMDQSMMIQTRNEESFLTAREDLTKVPFMSNDHPNTMTNTVDQHNDRNEDGHIHVDIETKSYIDVKKKDNPISVDKVNEFDTVKGHLDNTQDNRGDMDMTEFHKNPIDINTNNIDIMKSVSEDNMMTLDKNIFSNQISVQEDDTTTTLKNNDSYIQVANNHIGVPIDDMLHMTTEKNIIASNIPNKVDEIKYNTNQQDDFDFHDNDNNDNSDKYIRTSEHYSVETEVQADTTSATEEKFIKTPLFSDLFTIVSSITPSQWLTILKQLLPVINSTIQTKQDIIKITQNYTTIQLQLLNLYTQKEANTSSQSTMLRLSQVVNGLKASIESEVLENITKEIQAVEDQIMCINLAMMVCGPFLLPNEILNGALSVDKLYKEYKRLGGCRLELWKVLISHIFHMYSIDSSLYLYDKLIKSMTSSLGSSLVEEDDISRFQRKVSKLIQSCLDAEKQQQIHQKNRAVSPPLPLPQSSSTKISQSNNNYGNRNTKDNRHSTPIISHRQNPYEYNQEYNQTIISPQDSVTSALTNTCISPDHILSPISSTTPKDDIIDFIHTTKLPPPATTTTTNTNGRPSTTTTTTNTTNTNKVILSSWATTTSSLFPTSPLSPSSAVSKETHDLLSSDEYQTISSSFDKKSSPVLSPTSSTSTYQKKTIRPQSPNINKSYNYAALGIHNTKNIKELDFDEIEDDDSAGDLKAKITKTTARNTSQNTGGILLSARSTHSTSMRRRPLKSITGDDDDDLY